MSKVYIKLGCNTCGRYYEIKIDTGFIGTFSQETPDINDVCICKNKKVKK